MNKLKRTLAALTAAIVCTMGTPVVLPELADTAVMTASAAEELTYGDLTYKVNDDGTISITGCDKSAEVVEIPAQIDGKAVTVIGGAVFYGCTSLTSITIPESVTVIGASAFSECTSLTSITIPESVTEICGAAFYGCTSLTSVTIPESVTVIGGGVFDGCTSLTSITIPEGVTTIYSYTFCDCTSLTSITIPESVTVIDECVFMRCTSLTNVTIPENVTGIYSYAFYSCTSLTSVTIPESVTFIGWGAFEDCTSLTDVYYTGTEEQWNAVEFENDGASLLTNATIHFNSTAPVEPDFLLGDVNGDSAINASDAAVVLIAAAQIGASEDPGLTEAQRKAADVNKDGKINASDAAVILMYAAAVGAGQTDVKIEDFV